MVEQDCHKKGSISAWNIILKNIGFTKSEKLEWKIGKMRLERWGQKQQQKGHTCLGDLEAPKYN